MRRYCIEGCGRETGAYSKTGRRNPYWCSECDEIRIARIGRQFEAIAQGMAEKAKDYPLYKRPTGGKG